MTRPDDLTPFIAAANADPADRIPRLIFADYLEERGWRRTPAALRRMAGPKRCLAGSIGSGSGIGGSGSGSGGIGIGIGIGSGSGIGGSGSGSGGIGGSGSGSGDTIPGGLVMAPVGAVVMIVGRGAYWNRVHVGRVTDHGDGEYVLDDASMILRSGCEDDWPRLAREKAKPSGMLASYIGRVWESSDASVYLWSGELPK